MLFLFFVSRNRGVIQSCSHDLEKNSHNICETLIKLFMLKAADLGLEKTDSRKTVKKLLLDSTIKTPIDKLTKEIEYQVLQKLQISLFFNSM